MPTLLAVPCAHLQIEVLRRPVEFAENTVVYASGDLAYTVGFERGPVSVDGGPERDMVIRVTHIYRRFGEEWMLVHRHADFPPADQRRA